MSTFKDNRVLVKLHAEFSSNKLPGFYISNHHRQQQQQHSVSQTLAVINRLFTCNPHVRLRSHGRT